MPRERIPTHSTPNDSGFGLQVGWSRDLPDVSIGVSITTDSFVFLNGIDQAWLGAQIEALAANKEYATQGRGMAMIEALKATATTYESLWAQMTDRSAVNTMIRVLRRARGQAFGRDE